MARERNARKERGAGGFDGVVRRLELLLGLADIRPPVDELGRQARRHARHRDGLHAGATRIEVLRRLAGENRKRRSALAERFLERRDRRPHLLDQALLLGEIEVRLGADLELLLDQEQDAA